MFRVPEKHRVAKGSLRSDASFGNNGAFIVQSVKLKRALFCIASDGDGWEHVSVSIPDRCPTWEEMSYIKSLFWDCDDMVVQFHPVKAEYVNNHQFCLHLWRKAGTNDFCETPPAYMVGIKSETCGIGGGE